MAARLDPAKAAEAAAEMKEGNKAISTSLLKWKADYVDAEPHFQRAARAFKSAGLLDSAVEAWRKAADCSIKMGNLKQAAVTLESAGRELAVLKEESSKVGACKLWAEAGGLLQEAGEAVRAADLKLRAAKLVEAFDTDLTLRLTDEACNIFDGDTDKDVYAVEPLRKAMQMQLALGKHASAMRTMDRLFGVWTRLNQKHNLFKLVLSRVVLLLAAADPVSAQREYEKHFNLDGFVSTDEAAGAEDLLSAYTEMDQEGMKKVLERSVFGFLENTVTRIARGLPEAVMNGTTVGVKKADESASKAVDYKVAAAGTFTELGAGGPVSMGFAAAAETLSEGDAKAAARAQKKSDKDSDARASLFARPTGGATAAAAAAAEPAQEDEAFAFGGPDEAELGAALQGMGVTGEEEFDMT